MDDRSVGRASPERPGQDGDRLRVLLVGHGAPTRGGIPTFLAGLVADEWLGERVHLEFLNAAPRGTKLPGAFNVGNLGRTFLHAWRIARRARAVDVVHLNLAVTPTLPLIRGLVLAGTARAAGARVLVHAHTGLLETCVQRRSFRVFLRWTLRLVDAF